VPAAHSAAHEHRQELRAALLLSSGILLVELIAGLVSNSVALLADAGHVFADVSGMALSAFAIWMANRAPTAGRSFGLYLTHCCCSQFQGS
jgi:cobalt-zinc-cadmium efflux system protein